MDHLFRKLRHQPSVEEIGLDSVRRILGVEVCLKVDNIWVSLQLQRERIMRDIDIADPKGVH